MENNEQIEETQDTSAEDVKDETQEDTTDWKAEALKNKAILERKEKKLQELISGEKPEETKKQETEQNAPTIEHMAILSQDPNVEKLQFAEKFAKLEGISLTDAYNGEVCQAKFAQMTAQANAKANAMPASTGSAPLREKTPSNMTDEEHRKWAEDKLSNAVNG